MRYLGVDAAKKISKIGLGTWQFGSGEWNYGERYAGQHAPAIVRRALELGVTLFDTAEIYGVAARSLACRALVRGLAVGDVAGIGGFGRSEQILGEALGEALADGLDGAVLATKFYPTVPAAPAVGGRAAASAKRLRTAGIDLFQVHQPGRLLRNNSVMRAVRELQRAGIVAEAGISNGSMTAWRAAEQALGGRVLSNQVAYSLLAREPERDLLPYAAAQRRVIIAHSPLARGLLAGQYDRWHRPADRARSAAASFRPAALDRAAPLLATLGEVARAHRATHAQIALAWVIRHPAVAAIPGAASVEQLESNVAAADIELADDEYAALRAASDRLAGPAAGRRRSR